MNQPWYLVYLSRSNMPVNFFKRGKIISFNLNEIGGELIFTLMKLFFCLFEK